MAKYQNKTPMGTNNKAVSTGGKAVNSGANAGEGARQSMTNPEARGRNADGASVNLGLVVKDIKKIGILAGIILVVIVILYFVLP